jgi:hypothetical protein
MVVTILFYAIAIRLLGALSVGDEREKYYFLTAAFPKTLP